MAGSGPRVAGLAGLAKRGVTSLTPVTAGAWDE